MAAFGSIADRIHRMLAIVSRVLNAIGTLVVLALVVVVNFDVVARGVFDAPFHGTYELVQFSMVLIVFLQLPDVVRAGKLTRSDGMLLAMNASRPLTTLVVRRVIDLVSATLMLLVAITIWPEFVEDWQTNDFFGTPGIFTAPWWPVRLVIFVGSVLCCLIWLFKAFGTVSLDDVSKQAADT